MFRAFFLLYLFSHSTVNYSTRCLIDLENPIFRFSHQGNKMPSIVSSEDKEPCFLFSGSACASVWRIRLVDVEAQTSVCSHGSSCLGILN
jgi:hypothetical protein